MTPTNDVMIRHLLDLCRKSEKTGSWQYSGFLSLAEQDDFLRSKESAGFSFLLSGGYENAERKILAAGNETEMGPLDPPVSVIAVKPKSEKYAEELTHRDYLGAVLGLGIERSLVGDILVREHRAWLFCLSSAADMIVSSLDQVRRTTVTAEITAAVANLSRGQTDKLFAAEKVFVNGRMATDRSARLKEGDTFSVRGFGKAVYDGIDYETKKSRYMVRIRKLI